MNPFGPPSPYAERPPPNLESVPRAPRVPSPRARELVFGFGAGSGVTAIVGVAFMMMGSLFSFIFCRNLPSDVALSAVGMTQEGHVVSHKSDLTMSVNRRHPTNVRFRYDVDGTEHESESSTMLDVNAIADGSSVHVEYLGFAPDTARIVGTTRNEAGYAVAFVLLFPCVGLALVTRAFVARSRRRRAFVGGSATMGRVVFAGPDTSVRVMGKNPIKVAWTFNDPRGREFKGSVSHMDPAMLFGYVYDAPIVVLYDPDNPKANTLWLD